MVDCGGRRRVERQIRELEPVTEGVSLEVEGGRAPAARADSPETGRSGSSPAPPPTLGIEIEEALVGGASDGNITSAHTATLDGLGAVGDGAHAEHEHVVVDRMPERAALLAMLLRARLRGEIAPAGTHEEPAPGNSVRAPDHRRVGRQDRRLRRPWSSRLPRDSWATGDYVVGEMLETGELPCRVETVTGRIARLAPGDRLIGALGTPRRHARGGGRLAGDRRGPRHAHN